MAFLNFSVFTGYFVILIGIAVVRSRQMEDMSDYVLGSRRTSAFTSALSASSSAVSSGSMLVVPALAFVDGGVTLVTPPPSRDVMELFDTVNTPKT